MRALGVVSLLMGAFMSVYLVWAIFFNPRPPQSGNPYSAILLVVMMFSVGWKWFKGEKVE